MFFLYIQNGLLDHLKADAPISYNYTVLCRLSSLFCISGRPMCLSCIFCDIFGYFLLL